MKNIRIVLCLIFCAALTNGYAKSRPKPEPIPPEKLPPIRIILLSGQSNMVGHNNKARLIEFRPSFAKPRDDVWLVGGSIPGRTLEGTGSGNFGVELSMGYKLGEALEEPVVFIKAAMDGKSLWEDFRPPSAVKKRGGKVGGCYTSMMTGYTRALEHLDMFLPELAGRRYELSGFVWFQGEADGTRGTKEVWAEYEANLKDLIHDVRTEFQVPRMPALIIQINDRKEGVEPEKPGEDGNYSGWHYVREAQKKVAEDDPNADWVLTLDQSPALHYDPLSYVNIGDRCAEKMLKLLTKEPQNHRDSAGVKAAIKKYILSKIKPPMTEKPDMKALCKGLYAYFPFDGAVLEGEGRRKKSIIRGAAVQPVGGTVGSLEDGKRPDRWVDGIQGKAIRLRGQNLLHFPDFKEPVDDKGMLGDMTVSFWAQSNSKKTRGYRIGRGAGYRLQRDADNWYRSWEANYAGWDIVRVGSHGENSFTTSMERIGCHSLRAWGFGQDGIRWSHIVVMYDRKAGEKSIWYNGERQSAETLDKGLGIMAAKAPLAIGVEFGDIKEFMSFDELCMWSRVLTENEIKSLYNNGHGLALPTEAP